MSSSAYIPFDALLEKQQIEPVLIGGFFCFTLFGIGLLQFYHAYRLLERSQEKETLNYIILTSFLVVDLVDTITKGMFLCDLVKTDVVLGVIGALSVPRTVFAIAFTSALTASLTHLYYARRIYKITRTWKSATYVKVGLVVALIGSAVQFAAACFSGYVGLLPVEEWGRSGPAPSIWLGTSSAIDIFLCFLLTWYLMSQKSDFKATNDVLMRWASLTLETGLLPTLVQITDLTLSLVYKDKPYHIAVNFVLPKTYINCVLFLFVAILQTRDARSPQATSNNGGWQSKAPRYRGTTSNPSHINATSDRTTVVDVASVELPFRSNAVRIRGEEFDDANSIIHEKQYGHRDLEKLG